MSSPSPKRRFNPVMDEDVEEILNERVPKSTKDCTSVWVRVFEAFVEENDEIECDLKVCSREQLAEVLCKCYVAMKKKDGTAYQRSSYNGFRAALNRHLEDRGFDLFSDSAFARCNSVFDGVLKRLKREGKLRPIKHKDPISDPDLRKINYTFGTKKDPVTLLQQVWFFVTLHFGLRAREVQASMRKGDLVLCRDANGKEYFTLSTDFVTKNHQNDSSAQTAGCIQDSHQVFSIKMYLSKLNPSCDRLFQRPNIDQCGKQPWYFNSPIGKNKMDTML